MNSLEVENMVREQENRFSPIKVQINSISSLITDLKTELAEISEKAFYLGKAKRLAELKAELEEASKEKEILLKEKESMLLCYADGRKIVEVLLNECELEFDKQILQKVKLYVAKINDLILKGSDMETSLHQEVREELEKISPYFTRKDSDMFKHSVVYQSLSSKITYQILSINNNRVR